MGRQCDTVQHALYRAGGQLVRGQDRRIGRLCLRHAAIFAGALRAQFQVCCDYVFAFAALGLAGFFRNWKNGLLWGYIVAVLARGAFHSLGGYLYWMDYMPENFPQSLRALYPIIYNYSYLLAEGILTVIVMKIPAVDKALERVRQSAVK